MKNTLLTLSLLVSSSLVFADGGTKSVKAPEPKAAIVVEKETIEETEKSDDSVEDEDTKEEDNTPSWFSRAKTTVLDNKKMYFGVPASVITVGGLGYAGYKNPRTVRAFGKVLKRFARLTLKAAKANKWRTAVVVAAPVAALGFYNRAAVSTQLTKFSGFCSDKWENRPKWENRWEILWNKPAVESNEDDKSSEDASVAVEKTTEEVVISN